jgi:hypothetical protein
MLHYTMAYELAMHPDVRRERERRENVGQVEG